MTTARTPLEEARRLALHRFMEMAPPSQILSLAQLEVCEWSLDEIAHLFLGADADATRDRRVATNDHLSDYDMDELLTDAYRSQFAKLIVKKMENLNVMPNETALARIASESARPVPAMARVRYLGALETRVVNPRAPLGLLPTGDDQIGLRLWESELYMMEIVDMLKLNMKCARVVEIGAGVGLAGLLARHLGAREVWLTDRNQAVRENLMVVSDKYEHVHVDKLDWSDDSPEDSKIGRDETFDVVLAADVVYDARDAAPMLALLCRLLEPQSGFAILVVNQRNQDTFGVFLRRVQAYNDSARAGEAKFRVREIDPSVVPSLNFSPESTHTLLRAWRRDMLRAYVVASEMRMQSVFASEDLLAEEAAATG